MINNASVFEDDRIETPTLDGWRKHMEVNLHAPLVLSQAFAAELPADGTGLIINILDQRVWNLNPQFFSYSLSKAALWMATRTMAQGLAPRIRVNGIGPGPTLPSIHQTPNCSRRGSRAHPAARATPADISAAALYIRIDAPTVTGQMIGWSTAASTWPRLTPTLSSASPGHEQSPLHPDRSACPPQHSCATSACRPKWVSIRT